MHFLAFFWSIICVCVFYYVFLSQDTSAKTFPAFNEGLLFKIGEIAPQATKQAGDFCHVQL